MSDSAGLAARSREPGAGPAPPQLPSPPQAAVGGPEVAVPRCLGLQRAWELASPRQREQQRGPSSCAAAQARRGSAAGTFAAPLLGVAGRDGASVPRAGARCVHGSRPGAEERPQLLPPASTYSSACSLSSPDSDSSVSCLELEREEQEALKYLQAFPTGPEQVTRDLVSPAVPAAPSWLPPRPLPAARLWEGCWLCPAAASGWPAPI